MFVIFYDQISLVKLYLIVLELAVVAECSTQFHFYTKNIKEYMYMSHCC